METRPEGEDQETSPTLEETTASSGDEPGAPVEEVTEPPAAVSEVDLLRQQVASLEEAQRELQDKYLRLLAEFDNFRKRMRKEREEVWDQARGDFLLKLLPVRDDLRRALGHPERRGGLKALREGILLVERKLEALLASEGLEELKVGGRFDPYLHEAVGMEDTQDPEKDQTIAEVYQTGYRLKDRLLRPVQVRVYRYVDRSTTEAEPQPE